MMIEHDEMNEAKFLYACASMKVAIASFLEVCEVYGCASDGLVKMLDESREAIDGLFAGKAVVVPGAAMKAMTVARHFAPDSVLARITYHFQHKKGAK